MVNTNGCIFVFYMKLLFCQDRNYRSDLIASTLSASQAGCRQTGRSYTSATTMLRSLFITVLLSLTFFPTIAQDSAYQQAVSTAKKKLPPASSNRPIGAWELKPQYPYNKKRVRLVAIGNIVGYSGAMIGLYSAWYKNYPQTNFHSFNDSREWLQVDKVGHLYSAYAESYGSMEMWRWAGLPRKQRIWIGGMSGMAYQTVIEVLDGFSEGWGWSWSDIGANILGSGILVAQELAWDEQRIRIKFSFHQRSYGDAQLNQRANSIFGKGPAERFLKDYNAQTYWASVNLKSFFPESKLPRWLNVAVGYGAEGLFGADNNIATDEQGNVTFNRTDVKRYRQWFLAPDIDLSKIKTNKKGVRIALGILNILKFPTPSLEFSNGRFRVNAIHF